MPKQACKPGFMPLGGSENILIFHYLPRVLSTRPTPNQPQPGPVPKLNPAVF